MVATISSKLSGFIVDGLSINLFDIFGICNLLLKNDLFLM